MTLQGTWDETERADVVTIIFGGDENENPRHSAIPWKFDEWFHGDFTTEREGSLSQVMGSKSLNEYGGETFPNYRMDTVVEIGFNTPDGQTIPDGEWEVQMTDPSDSTTSGSLAPVTLEGEADEPSNPFRNSLDHYDNPSEQYLDATVKGPYTKTKKFTIDGKGIEGIRGSIILGGSDPYLQKMKEDGYNLKALVPDPIPGYINRYTTHVATFYSFIDFAFMADGTKVVTVWDASHYPAHALYVGGDRKDRTKFREGIEWVKQGAAEEHQSFWTFGLDAQNPFATPFDQGGAFAYDHTLGLGNHPKMNYRDAGTELSGEESEFSNAMYPEFPIF